MSKPPSMKPNVPPKKSSFESFKEKFEHYIDILITYVKRFSCWEVTIKYYSYNIDPTKQWIPWDIPVLQYLIAFFWTLFYLKPAIIGGEYNFAIFQDVILFIMGLYLLIRFSYITEKHEKITECDVWIVQTVAFIFFAEYLLTNISKMYNTNTIDGVSHSG